MKSSHVTSFLATENRKKEEYERQSLFVYNIFIELNYYYYFSQWLKTRVKIKKYSYALACKKPYTINRTGKHFVFHIKKGACKKDTFSFYHFTVPQS